MAFEQIRALYNIKENEIDGFAAAEMDALEGRIGSELPKQLRKYYLALGKNESINFSHNRLFTPSEIDFSDDGYLIFYEENQVVVYWGIKAPDLRLDNPPVYGNYSPNNASSDWHLEATTTEDFLLLMAVYNGTFGGLKYNANSFEQVKPSVVKYIEANWEEISAISFPKQKIYTDKFDEVISLSFDDNNNCSAIFIGTSHQQRFDNLLDNLDVEWSYISYEDEEDDEIEII